MIRASLLLLAAVIACHGAVDVDRMVDAVRQVENAGGRDGRAGERGPWQLTPAVWSMQMPGRPFAEARREGEARTCATREIERLARLLRARGVDDNAFNVALCWNAGFTAATTGRAPVRAYDYARRVQAIYNGAIGQNTVKRPESANRVAAGFICDGDFEYTVKRECSHKPSLLRFSDLEYRRN